MSNFIHKIGIDHATAMNKNCNLGLITTAEQYTDKGAYKTFHNNVWSDIKSKAEIYSEGIFELLKKYQKKMLFRIIKMMIGENRMIIFLPL